MEKEASNYKIKKEVRVPTGINYFDDLIEGGFEKNSINLMVGGTGSGKTIFATQFLMEGIKRGENCLYITFEEKKEGFYDNMKEFGWDLKKFETDGNFTFLEYTPEKVKTMLEEGGGVVESIILRKKISRVVMDSITSFELLFDGDVAKREAALALFDMLREWNCTSLLTYEGSPTTKKKVSSRTLEFESDSITLMYFVRTGKKRERYIEILKMRKTNHSREIHTMDIKPSGIFVNKEEFTGKLEGI